MNPNDNKNRPNGGKGGGSGSWRGVVSLVCWAMLLTIIINSATAYFGSAGRQASSVTIENSQFVDMVKQGQVDRVDFDTSEDILIITPKDGYVYTGSDGVEYTKGKDAQGNSCYTYTDAAGQTQQTNLSLFTVQIRSNDEVVKLLDEYGVEYDQAYQARMNPLLSAFIELVLPFVLIILMFSIAMRWMSKKGGIGGMGGIGGVVKANAKVYM